MGTIKMGCITPKCMVYLGTACALGQYGHSVYQFALQNFNNWSAYAQTSTNKQSSITHQVSHRIYQGMMAAIAHIQMIGLVCIGMGMIFAGVKGGEVKSVLDPFIEIGRDLLDKLHLPNMLGN